MSNGEKTGQDSTTPSPSAYAFAARYIDDEGCMASPQEREQLARLFAECRRAALEEAAKHVKRGEAMSNGEKTGQDSATAKPNLSVRSLIEWASSWVPDVPEGQRARFVAALRDELKTHGLVEEEERSHG